MTSGDELTLVYSVGMAGYAGEDGPLIMLHSVTPDPPAVKGMVTEPLPQIE